jgi:DHA1 family multidrug resistance protein-like MFS transporter
MLPNRQQIRLLLPLGTAVALSLAGDSTLYAVLANQTEVLGISLAGVGALLGVNRLIRIPGNPLAGILHDRWGRRRLFLLGLLLGIVSTFGYSLVRGFWPLFAARLLWGAAWALINVGGYTMILDRSTPADRGRMAGFYQVSYMLGLSISPILGGALTDLLGFRPAVRICAAISSIGLAVALMALPETRPPSGGSYAGGSRAIPRRSLAELVGVLRRVDRRILLAGYIYLVTFFVSNVVLMSTVGLYLGQRWGESISLNGAVIGVSSLAGMLLSLRALLGIVAGPAAGILSDRLRDRWVVARGGILLGVSGFLLLSLLASIWAVPGGVALVSLSAGGLIAVLAALVGDLAVNDRPGITMGGLATAGDIGSATGPLLAYALVTALDLRQIYLLCAVVLASGLLATAGKMKDR